MFTLECHKHMHQILKANAVSHCCVTIQHKLLLLTLPTSLSFESISVTRYSQSVAVICSN